MKALDLDSTAPTDKTASQPGLDVFSQTYEARFLFLTVGIMAMSGLDAHWTLLLLRTGSVVEVNPIMLALIEYDTQVFLMTKSIITGIGLVALVACSRLSLSRHRIAQSALYALFTIYAVLILYESMMIRGFY